ncbi:cell division protein FtsQ/DivIB [Antrihabitans cavernicola]|uniref:FtsQ-type POTRA domain-containing protein n=1 Tax=Antrihabitans cavernicola TaxID=2495913 RepID=A0A5A7SD84_9NOCA|nr:FtsQ-type POTRA domain-containing protein [Spelaeibacter cavernicola]KAA0023142.1 FtsQ-type POTRA domain-containing protein [Spelaeibacter cavernicola]
MSRARDRRRRSESSRSGSSRSDETETKTGLRKWWPVWAISAVVVVIALFALAYFTPLLSVRKVSVLGLHSIPQEQVVSALAVPDGRPLLRVDTNAAAKRVAQIPKVAQVRVQRDYPSSIKVTVTERTPVVFFDSPQGTHLLDATGVDYAIEPPPPGVPRLKVGNPGQGDPATKAVLDVLAATPPPLRVQVGEVAAKSISDIRLTLLDGRVVVWGSEEHSDRKAAVALPVLSQQGQTYDVSSPDLPTVK